MNFENILHLSEFREIQQGIPVYTENDEYIGESKVAAKTAILQVLVSRIAMASPGMGLSINTPSSYSFIAIISILQFVRHLY